MTYRTIKRGVFFIALFYSLSLCCAPSVNEKRHTIASSQLGTTTSIQVVIPDSYVHSSSTYPVLFVLDSQRYLLQAVAHQQSLRFKDRSPEMIIVGIDTTQQDRRRWFYSEPEPFIAYLSNELVPWVDERYRTSGERVYFGWELAAGLATDIMVQRQDLFDGYILASPTRINAARLGSVDKYISRKHKTSWGYVTLGQVESWSVSSVETLIDTLSSSTYTNWQFEMLDDFDHYSSPLITLNKGLLRYFSDYPSLRFYSINEFHHFGGLGAVQAHYHNRGKRYGLSTDIHPDTKHHLLNQCLKENNWALFNDLSGSWPEFIPQYYARAFWFKRYANAYIQLGDLDKAISTLQSGLIKIPNSGQLHGLLAELFAKNNQAEKATQHYRLAITNESDTEHRKALELKLQALLQK